MRFAATTGLDIPVPRMASASVSTSTTRVVDSSTPNENKAGGRHTPTPIMLDSMPGPPRDTLTPTPTPSNNLALPLSRGATPTPTPTSKHRTPKPSLSFRNRDKPSPGTPPARPRGKTVPSGQGLHTSRSQTLMESKSKPQTPDGMSERDTDRDTDSVLSFTPSMSGKNIATWFSGLLGRAAS
ncbi:hypothetical protein EJ02DRAFT_345838 [Clathrospora elynae]|uniref:Uncharacterized protein n=1 Tax=Clathrospora elynae TaxID=706981 RepID=A0A6A5SUT9_9PLEO|nr:hypothetical protein EJ02DRAFT_345838 [Clathrospora elynae]